MATLLAAQSVPACPPACPPPPDLDEISSTAGSVHPGVAPGQTPEAPLAEAQQPATTLLQIDAQLGELAIFASGRTPEVWWPPDDAPPEPKEAEGAEEAPGDDAPAAGKRAAVVNVDQEVALIVVRAGAWRFHPPRTRAGCGCCARSAHPPAARAPCTRSWRHLPLHLWRPGHGGLHRTGQPGD